MSSAAFCVCNPFPLLRSCSALLYLKTTGRVANVWQKPLDGDEATQLTWFDRDQIVSFTGVAMSRDGKQLAVIRTSNTSDVVLIKDLQAR